MPARTDRQLAATTAHQIAGQVVALQSVRARIQPAMDATECRAVIDAEIALLQSRLAVNAATGTPLLGEIRV